MKLLRYTSLILLAVFATFIIGCDDDVDDLINLTAGFTQNVSDDEGTITFINTSENAKTYAWDFGDGGVSTEIDPSHTYATGTYIVILTASNGSFSASFSDTIDVQVPEDFSLPANFDNSNVEYVATTFNGAAFEVVDNPDLSGINNTASQVGKITNSGAAFEGLFFDLGTAIDLSTDMSITMKFWSNTALDVLLKLEEGTAGPIETTASHGGTGWEMITFNFNSTSQYSRLTLFVDGPGTTAGDFYIDDISQTATGDITAPTIILNGDATINLSVGDAFTDPGATAMDDVDGDISGSIVVAGDAVDINTEGTYVITYNVSDAAGNSANEVTRTVNVGPVTLFPVDFEDGGTLTGAFDGGANGANANNPDPSGINTSSKVYQFNKIAGAAWYSGTFNVFSEDIDPAGGTTFKFKIWSPNANINVRFQLEKEGNQGPIVTYNMDQTLTQANQWVEMEFDLSGTALNLNDGYDKIVIFPDFNDANQVPVATEAIYYIDDIDQGAGSGGGGGGTGCTDTDLKLPLDFDCESTTYDFVTFNGASYQVVDNPQLSGVNAVASKVGEIVNTGNNWEGGAFTLANAVDFSTDKSITMKVYSTVAVPVLLKFEGAGAPIETPVNHGGTGWEELTFEFTSSDQFNTLVVFIDGPGTTAGTFYFDDIEQVTAGGGTCTDTDLKLPLDFDCESTTYDFVTFNGASYQVIDNPQLSGVNAVASKVGEVVNTGNNWEGGAFTLANAVDFSGDKSITMKIYSTVAIPVLLKFEGAGAPIETPVNHGGTGWEQLTFDFTSSDQFNTLVIFMDGPGTTAGTFYFDNIEQVATGGGGGGGSGGELATNGDFETGDDTGWLLFQNGGSAVIDNTVNNGGSFSGKLATNGPSNPAFKQEGIGVGAVNAGDVIEITFDHMGSVTQPGAVFNVLLFGESAGGGGASFTHVFNPAPTPTNSWTTFTGTFTIPNGTDVSGGISFLIEAVCGGDAGCSVTANIDNVSVTVQ